MADAVGLCDLLASGVLRKIVTPKKRAQIMMCPGPPNFNHSVDPRARIGIAFAAPDCVRPKILMPAPARPSANSSTSVVGTLLNLERRMNDAEPLWDH